jgi:NAD(P)-dependent dehydrogenase (short-subunit alcohol dehydrogenase family)
VADQTTPSGVQLVAASSQATSGKGNHVSAATRFDFSDKVIVITGGGTGIGKGIGDAFVRAGGTVVVTGRRTEPLEAFCAEHPGRSSWIQMDVGLDADRRRTIETVVERHGQLDVLVNNAYAFHGKPFGALSFEEIETMYAICLVAPTALLRLALPHLIAARGSVINISSIAGRYVQYPPENLAVYAAAKAGLNQLTRALGSELGPHGVRVNSVAPGVTRTEATPDNPEIVKALMQVTPMGRMGEPIDIANVVLFLASDAAGWVTGQLIDASGGCGIAG